MNYEQLIKNWHTKASREDYFSKFIFEYLAFIAYLKKQKYRENEPNKDTDRNAIQKLKIDTHIKNLYLEKINSKIILKKDWEKIKEELDRAPLGNVSGNQDIAEEIKWWNCSHNQCNQKTGEERRMSNGVIHSLDDWENMVEFWHSIRNNLFHAAKNPKDDRDQLVVKYGYKTLRELMKIFLNEMRWIDMKNTILRAIGAIGIVAAMSGLFLNLAASSAMYPLLDAMFAGGAVIALESAAFH